MYERTAVAGSSGSGTALSAATRRRDAPEKSGATLTDCLICALTDCLICLTVLYVPSLLVCATSLLELTAVAAFSGRGTAFSAATRRSDAPEKSGERNASSRLRGILGQLC